MADADNSSNGKPFDHEKTVAKLAQRFRTGRLPFTYDHVAKSQPGLWPQFKVAQDEAIALVREEQEAEEIHARRQAIKAKAAAAQGLQRLVDEDTGITVPIAHLDGMERAIRALFDQTDLDAYNAELKAKSKPITYRDVAFVACIHHLSVTDNGQDNAVYAATSPFERIAKASTALAYRETRFDNRQIRYALRILEVIGFTTEVQKAVYSTRDKSQNRAATWSISTDEFWSKIFR